MDIPISTPPAKLPASIDRSGLGAFGFFSCVAVVVEAMATCSTNPCAMMQWADKDTSQTKEIIGLLFSPLCSLVATAQAFFPSKLNVYGESDQ